MIKLSQVLRIISLPGALRKVLLGALFVSIALVARAQDAIWDGNWWRVLEKTQKQSVVLGFFIGANHGCQLSTTAFADGFPVEGSSITTRCVENMKTFGRTNTGQLVEGLDALYSDFRNRSVPFGMAMWYVANQASGTHQSRLNELIDAMRRQAKE